MEDLTGDYEPTNVTMRVVTFEEGMEKRHPPRRFRWRHPVLLPPVYLTLLMACAGDLPLPPSPEVADTTPQILFGDLHVHSTLSVDALLTSTPILGGVGAAGPEARCDFARYCSQLDFWSINDHPEWVPTETWDRTKEAIRTCNALEGGDGPNPRMVSFLGWEWTQSSDDPTRSWGHKNVILLDTADDKVPTRPIRAGGDLSVGIPEEVVQPAVILARNMDKENEGYYQELGDYVLQGLREDVCPAGVDVRDLPVDCAEEAEDPATLYEKLSQWGFPAIVIPHGTTWGTHNPGGSGWQYQLNRRQHDPEYEIAVEIFSGHGNAEEYRTWSAVTTDTQDVRWCPAPSEDYLPCCHQAGKLTRKYHADCIDAPEGAGCREAVTAAELAFVDGGAFAAQSTVPQASAEEWLDCGQCNDCFQPAFRYRPGYSVQAALAQTNFDDPDNPLRYHWGFIGSTDSHRAGPGAGYKEGREMSDQTGAASPELATLLDPFFPSFFPEFERQGNYWYSGALVAVHSKGRNRQAIWDALQRREVYATTGERLLLWFDLLNGPDGEAAMGSRLTFTGEPRFKVRAVGAFRQKPGCPADVIAAAPQGFIENSCLGECYHPTDERYRITRIEVVRIRPQIDPEEPLDELIDDPWKILDCPGLPAGCEVTFSDPDFEAEDRPATYYVRAIQEPTPQFNAGGLRCERDEDGNCVKPDFCPAGFRGVEDDCMMEDEERAWSSPIYLERRP